MRGSSHSLTFGKDIFGRYPLQMVLITLCLLIAGVLEIIGLAAILPVMDQLLNSEGEQAQGVIGEVLSILPFQVNNVAEGLTIIVVFMALRGVFIFFSQYLSGYLAAHMERDIRDQIMNTILKANWLYHLRQNAGTLTSSIIKETEYCAMAVMKFCSFLTGFIIAALLLTMSVLVSWQAFLVFTLSVIPYLLVGRWLNAKMRTFSAQRVDATAECSSSVIDSLSLAKFIKAQALEHQAFSRFETASQSAAQKNIKLALYQACIFAYPEVFGILTIAVLIYAMFTLDLVAAQDLVFFLLLMYRAYSQVARVQNSLSSLNVYLPSYDLARRIRDEAQTETETPKASDYNRDAFQSIEIKNLSLAYKDDKPIIENLTLSLPRNQVTAFVGRSGSGKTTLVDAIMGLIEPSQGSITIGQDLAQVNQAQLRDTIGYVPQDAYLINGSIRDNILIGAQDKSDENLQRVAKLAQLDELINGLPAGYDAPVGDRGSALSGGQKQRIALARALARKPDILILDEATSALDNETEKMVHEAISQLRDNLTIILIAHRLSTVKDADSIIMLDQGRIVDQGDFYTLIKRGSDFANLYQQGS